MSATGAVQPNYGGKVLSTVGWHKAVKRDSFPAALKRGSGLIHKIQISLGP
jgi:hypothetical protein